MDICFQKIKEEKVMIVMIKEARKALKDLESG
jgi:hypothetical protein